jgi:hypothetical protein
MDKGKRPMIDETVPNTSVSAFSSLDNSDYKKIHSSVIESFIRNKSAEGEASSATVSSSAVSSPSIISSTGVPRTWKLIKSKPKAVARITPRKRVIDKGKEPARTEVPIRTRDVMDKSAELNKSQHESPESRPFRPSDIEKYTNDYIKSIEDYIVHIHSFNASDTFSINEKDELLRPFVNWNNDKKLFNIHALMICIRDIYLKYCTVAPFNITPDEEKLGIDCKLMLSYYMTIYSYLSKIFTTYIPIEIYIQMVTSLINLHNVHILLYYNYTKSSMSNNKLFHMAMETLDYIVWELSKIEIKQVYVKPSEDMLKDIGSTSQNEQQ